MKMVYINYDLATSQEIEDYFNVILLTKGEIIDTLLTKVFGDEDVNKYDAKNIDFISDFIFDNFSFEKRSEEDIRIEINSLPDHLMSIHKPMEYEVIDDSYNNIQMVGVYIAELLHNCLNNLEWSYESNKKRAQYGRPIIVNRNRNRIFCPSWIMDVFCKKMLKGTADRKYLNQLFDIWGDQFKNAGN